MQAMIWFGMFGCCTVSLQDRLPGCWGRRSDGLDAVKLRQQADQMTPLQMFAEASQIAMAPLQMSADAVSDGPFVLVRMNFHALPLVSAGTLSDIRLKVEFPADILEDY